ncbi:hypothetical protein FKM82_011547 [Ascaphus truei]
MSSVNRKLLTGSCCLSQKNLIYIVMLFQKNHNNQGTLEYIIFCKEMYLRVLCVKPYSLNARIRSHNAWIHGANEMAELKTLKHVEYVIYSLLSQCRLPSFLCFLEVPLGFIIETFSLKVFHNNGIRDNPRQSVHHTGRRPFTSVSNHRNVFTCMREIRLEIEVTAARKYHTAYCIILNVPKYSYQHY